MKIKIAIEEIISKEFEVEVTSMENAHEEIRKMYLNDELILEDVELTATNVFIPNDPEKPYDGEWTEL